MQCIAHRHPKKHRPWHLPGDQRSLHLAPRSQHRPPSTSTIPTPPSLLPARAPSTKLCPFPSFALFQPLSPSPGAGEASPRARQSSRRRHQGGTSGEARESGALLPLTRRSLPSRCSAPRRQQPAPQQDTGAGKDAVSKLSCPWWGRGKEAFQPGLKFGLESPKSIWVLSLVSLQQLLTPAQRFARPAGATEDAKHFCRSPSLPGITARKPQHFNLFLPGQTQG